MIETLNFKLSLPELTMKKRNVILSFEPVDDFVWLNHSNETSYAVILLWYFLFFSILQNEILRHNIYLRHFQEAKSEIKNYSYAYLPSSLQLR